MRTFMHTELVRRKRPRLIRTKHVHSSQTLDSREFLDDSLLASEKSGTDSHSRRCDAWKTDGYPDDEENQGVDEKVVVGGCGDIDSAEESAWKINMNMLFVRTSEYS